MAFWEKGKTEEQINAVSERVNKVENDVADIIKTNMHIDKQFNIANEQQKKLYEDNIEMKKALISLTNNQKKLEEQLKDVLSAKKDIVNESNSENAAKNKFPDELSIEDICKHLKISKLDATAFRYYLHDIGVMALKINKYRNTYSLIDDYDSLECELKQYIHVHNSRTITFFKDSLKFFDMNKDKIVDSVEKYYRQLEQFNKSKEIINSTKSKGYKDEIHKICGTRDYYDENKWSAIYKEYSKIKPNWFNIFKKYESEWLENHPEYDKNSKRNKEFPLTRFKYIIEVFNDGDILLRIACELFVA